jgi:hypothetical protein
MKSRRWLLITVMIRLARVLVRRSTLISIRIRRDRIAWICSGRDQCP